MAGIEFDYNNYFEEQKQKSFKYNDLTPKEIFEAFPNEAKELVDICIKNENIIIFNWIKEGELIANFIYDNINEKILRIAIWRNMKKPTRAMKNLNSLKQMKLMMNVDETNKFYNSNDIDKAKKVSIVTLYSFKKAKMFGNKFVACCPFHNDNTPSALINNDNTFHCFSCNLHLDSIGFVQKLNNVNFKDALLYLLNI